MSFYRYKAVGKNGSILKGVLEASSPHELKTYMREKGLSLVTYSRKAPFLFSKKIRPPILMDFCLHLEQFEKAGIPLKQSLESLYQTQTSFKLKLILGETIKDVEGGTLLSKALAKHSSIFDPVFIGLIEVGEKTGTFSSVLQQLFQHLKWADEVKAQTLKTLSYPCIMAIVLISVIMILMTVLVPELSKFMDTFSGNKTFSTRLVIYLSNFLSKYAAWLFFSLGSLFFVLISFFNFHPNGSVWKGRLLDYLPFIGSLRYKIELTRFCHIFAVMFDSGVDIIQVLQTARKYLRNGKMYNALENVERFIKDGHSLSNAFQKVRFFPPLVIQMVKIGEQTNSLQQTLFYVKNYFDTMLKRQVDHILSLLEPMMILCLGTVMAWIIYSIFFPIYDVLLVLDY